MNRRVIGPVLLAAVIVFALIGLVASAVHSPEAEPVQEIALGQETKTVCHKEEGQPDKTLTVPISAYQAHKDHGDTDGPCGATPTVPVPTPLIATNTPVPATATSTNTPVPPTATATSTSVPPTATPTNTPGPGEPTATATPTEESVIVRITPSTNITSSTALSITLPTGDGLVCEPEAKPTCQYCCPGAENQANAEAERALAEARWYNALADALNSLMDGDVPEFLQLIFGSD